MCKTILTQEDADHILAVGHKVTYRGDECVISGIRVWHDLGTLLGPPCRCKPVFDLEGEGWSAMNIKIDDIDLWLPPPEMPTLPEQVLEGVEKDDKGHKRTEQSGASPATEQSG